MEIKYGSYPCITETPLAVYVTETNTKENLTQSKEFLHLANYNKSREMR